jgi:peptidoglycan/LPS O-acetylase OafA/YrhL
MPDGGPAPARPDAPRLRRMPAIDGLRAVAVAAVFLYHADAAWLPGGFFGVDVFFVISGYLITSLLLAESVQTGTVALLRFWAGRARRLLPALFTLLAVCMLVGATVERGRLLELRGDALSSIFYVANWRFIFEHESYFAQFGRPPLLRHLWSLAVEEQFYLIWPPLFLLALRLRARAVLPVLVALGAIGSTMLMWVLYTPGSDTSRVFYGTDTRAAPILVGALLAFLWKPSALPDVRNRVRARLLLETAGVLGLAGVLYAFIALHDFSTATYRGGFLVVSICAAVLLAVIVHPRCSLGRLFSLRVPRWIGERSYGIYLWHWPVLAFTRPGVDVHIARAPLALIQAAITVAIAEFSYHFIEQPIRTGALRRLRLRLPRFAAQPRTPLALTAGAVALLLGLVALTPEGVAALPPGITRQALASSERAASHLVLPPGFISTPVHHHETFPVAPPASEHHVVHHHHPAATPSIPRSGPILAVGDSVMLGASTELESALGSELRIDAVVSRQPEATIARLYAYRAEGSLPRRVIVHIGDNGPVYYADAQRLRAALKGVPLVVLVNVRVDTSWQGEVNSELRQTVAGWHQATIADWYDASTAPGLLADGTHTTPAGARAFAAVIARAIHAPHLGGVTR